MVSYDVTLDIISRLPNNILDNILICLPIEDAARTSILSTKWRDRWLYIPELVFNCDSGNFFRRLDAATWPLQTWSQICQILQLHRGPIHKFVLSVYRDENLSRQMSPLTFFEDESTNSYIKQIMVFLIQKDIQEFNLRPPSTAYFTLPSTLFQYIHLKHLSLSTCTIELPPDFIGFSKLVCVELHVVHVTAKDIKTFLSKCPFIQQLKVQRLYCPVVVIDAPNLKFLYFDSSSTAIALKNVPLLSTVIVKSALSPGKSSSILVMFGSLPAIEYFYAGDQFLMDLNEGVMLDRLPCMLNHLKSVELSGLCFNSLKELNCAILLVKSSPNLQKLKITGCIEYVIDIPKLQLSKALSIVEGSLNQLEEVTIEEFDGTVSELEFVKCLLAKSVKLKKMILLSPEPVLTEISVVFLKELNRFRRASPTAEVIYFDGNLEEGSSTSETESD